MSEVDALIAAGVESEARGDWASAEECYRRAIERDVRAARAFFHLGRLHFTQNRKSSALLFLRKAVACDPGDALAQALLAAALHESGRLVESLDVHRAAIRLRPDSWEYRFNFANALEDAGRRDEAAEQLHRAVELEPTAADAWSNLGRVLHALQRVDEALSAFERAAACEPTHAAAWSNRAACLRELGRWDDALACGRRAVEMAPDDADAQRNLGLTCVALQNFPDGLAALERAALLRPASAEILADLAGALREIGREESAILRYREAIESDPEHTRAWRNLADVLASLDRTEEARECYRRLATVSSKPRLWSFVADCCVSPIVFADQEAIEAHRETLERTLDRWIGEPLVDDWRELVEARCLPPFTLDHHGVDERPTREKFAAVFERSFDAFASPPPGSGKASLAILVTQGHEGVFLRSFAGVLEHFRRQELETTVLCSSVGASRLQQALGKTRARIRTLPAAVDAAARAIREERFDLLYFWEIGTDAWNYFLPFCRSAAGQCTSFGIQTTSGIGAVDVYLSSRLLEPPGAKAHYRERLELLEHLPAYVRRQAAPAKLASRSEWGLDDSSNLYVCPQRLAKIHPDFDDAAAKILRLDPKGLVILSAGRLQPLAERLRSRIARRHPDVAERFHLLPEPRGERYYSLLGRASVVLDTVHYGGVNTTYDAFAMGKAIVTVPGSYQRGRYAAGCYARMGINEPVCRDLDEYAKTAVRIAVDADFRCELERRIVDSRDLLYEDGAMAGELEEWFLEEIHRLREG